MDNYLQLNSTDDFTYILNSIGQDILINNKSVKAMITNTELHRIYDERKITTIQQIKTGDLIHYNDRHWLVNNEVNGQRYGKYKALIRACDYNIKFNFNGNIKEFPSCVDGKFFDLDTNKYINLSADQIMVTVQENEDTLQVKVNDRFIKMGSAWKVTGKNRTIVGLITFTCSKDVFNANDDIENEVADGKLYYVRITNTKPIEIDEGTNVQLTYEATTGANVIFVSSDPTIAKVDNTGLVTGLSAGTVRITVSLGGSETYKDTIEVIVNEVIQESYSIQIYSDSSPAGELKNNQSKVYKVNVYRGSEIVTDQPVTWSLFADNQSSTTTLASITSQDGSSCTVKNNAANSGYVQLKATLNSDDTVFVWFRIQMKSLF